MKKRKSERTGRKEGYFYDLPSSLPCACVWSVSFHGGDVAHLSSLDLPHTGSTRARTGPVLVAVATTTTTSPATGEKRLAKLVRKFFFFRK